MPSIRGSKSEHFPLMLCAFTPVAYQKSRKPAYSKIEHTHIDNHINFLLYFLFY